MKPLFCVRLVFALIAGMFSSTAFAECVDPITTPTECQFKREDTHLSVFQPGFYFSKEDRVDELIEQGESFIQNYNSSVKTTGDAATRFMIAPTVAAMGAVEAIEAVNLAITLANDPWQLKDIYTDIRCEIWFEIVGGTIGAGLGYENVDRDCPSTAELIVDIQKLAELDQVRQEILDIITNPNLVLGETWSDAIAEVESIRGRLDSLDTFGRNIATPDLNAFFDERYPSLTALLAAPNETAAQLSTRIGDLNTSRRNTIQDHFMATHQNHLNLRQHDQPELERLSEMSALSVGRMQGTEIDNMLKAQGVQNIQAITEEIMNINTLTTQDMADKHGDITRRRAYLMKSAEPILDHEVIVGNERVFRP